MRKMIEKILCILCAAALFAACNEAFRYILVDDTSSYTRLTMHQLYHPDENIDIAFIGSSHVYRSLVPNITDDGFGAYTFNCGTSSQYMDGSLAMVKELIKKNEVKHIYLEMYYDIALGSPNKERTQLTSTYIISDYMRPSFEKISYILQASSKEHWINGFVPARRNWEKFFDIPYMEKLISKKREDAYRNYQWAWTDGQKEYYVEKGYVANDGVAEETYINESAYQPINMDAISDDWKEALQTIICLCEREEIELTLFVAPMPEWTIVGKGNYDMYYDFVRTFADKSGGVELYDFNHVNNCYFSTRNRLYFKDEDHLNSMGAEAFSKLFCDFFMGKIRKEELFFESLEEKLANDEIMVYGIAGMQEDKENDLKRARIVASRDEEIEYKVMVIPENDDARLLQDFDKNTAIELPIESHGMLQIEWRLKNDRKETKVLEIEY